MDFVVVIVLPLCLPSFPAAPATIREPRFNYLVARLGDTPGPALVPGAFQSDGTLAAKPAILRGLESIHETGSFTHGFLGKVKRQLATRQRQLASVVGR